jgi:hypothetical protein
MQFTIKHPSREADAQYVWTLKPGTDGKCRGDEVDGPQFRDLKVPLN